VNTSLPIAVPTAPIRKRLWKLGVAVALLLLTLTIGNSLIEREKSVTGSMIGHDFLAFYTAGHFVQTEQTEKLYDMDAVREYQREVEQGSQLEVEKGFAPYWNPPFAALAFAPLADFSYHEALAIWEVVSGVVLVLSLAVLIKMLDSANWKNWALIPLLFIASMPFVQAATHGQNTFITLGLLLGVVVLWRSDMGLAAGMVAGLLFYKPQHAALIAAVLCFSMGRKAILGLAVTGMAIVCINITALPGTLEDFFTKMPANLRIMQELHLYYWERHATFKAFWRLLIQGKELGAPSLAVRVLWFLSAAAFAAPLILAAWREAGRKWVGSFGSLRAHEHARDRLIAATIACAPLLMPFYFDYDLLLLSIPAVLWARELLQNKIRQPLTKADRLCLTGWVGLYLWTFLNPPLAGRIRLDLTVIWVAMIAAGLVARALQGAAVQHAAIVEDHKTTPIAQAA